MTVQSHLTSAGIRPEKGGLDPSEGRPEVHPREVAMLFKGSEVYGIATIVKQFALTAPEIQFVCFREGPLTDWLRQRGHSVYLSGGPAHLSLKPGLGRLALVSLIERAGRSARELHWYLSEHRVRLIHTHWYAHQFVAGFLRHRGYRSVWQINSYVNRGRFLRLRQAAHRSVVRWSADLLLPASDFVRLDWRGARVPQRTIHNAAFPSEPARDAPEPPLRCIAVGRLTPIKGLHVAIEAVGRARDRGIDVRLDVFGGPLDDNPYAQELRQLIDRTGHGAAIRLVGFREDLRALHGDYHFGIQCRLDPEPCSLWVCEALFDGLPLLASATGGTPELIDDGRTGLLYEPGNVEELTQKILSLTRRPETLREMRIIALTEARKYFSTDRFVQETFDAYREVIGASCRPVPPRKPVRTPTEGRNLHLPR